VEANGLMTALAELCRDSARLYRTRCEFRCEQPVLLTDQTAATHVYRIAQEAISNAVRHGHARSIAVDLRHEDDEALLAVINDGEPLPPDPGRAGGMGLRIMRYRAEMIGATLRIGSTVAGKTELLCTFKLRR
jgi:signal transduction histidine kinase